MTAAEYERAAAATVACLEREGYQAQFVRDGSDGLIAFQILRHDPTHESIPRDDETRQDEAYDDCHAENFAEVEAAYVAVATADQREVLRRGFISCLQAAGVDISSDATDDDVAEVLPEATGQPEFDACISEVIESSVP